LLYRSLFKEQEKRLNYIAKVGKVHPQVTNDGS
jgi:hypothetical protein